MNIKEFKIRWLRGYIQPDLFKLPVKKETAFDDFEPMIIEVEAIGSDKNYTIYPHNWFYTGIYELEKDDEGIITNTTIATASNRVLYDLKTANGEKVTKSMFPEYFKKFINNIFFEEKSPFLKVDWGDGNIIDYTSQIITTRKINIEKTECTYNDIIYASSQTITNTDGTTTTTSVPIVHHTYKEDGRYTIKIYGNISGFYKSLILSPTDSNCTLKKIIKWGNLHLRNTTNILNADNNSYTSSALNRYYKPEYIQPLSELTNGEFKYVVSTENMFYHCDLTLNDIGTSDLAMFPNLIIADNMFCGTMVDYVPDNFLKYNTKLQNITSMFYACPLTYIGNYAFANLSDCIEGHTVVDTRIYRNSNPNYFYKNNINSNIQTISTLQKIGNSVFENDINFNSWISFEGCNNKNGNWTLTQIGDYLFRNCKKLKNVSYMFQRSLRLKKVGKGLFSNCISLDNANGAFFQCPSLTTIGNDLFKNCYYLRNTDSLFYGCPKLTIPDKLFYDLKVCNSNNEVIKADGYTGSRFSMDSLFYSHTIWHYNAVPNISLEWDANNLLRDSSDVADIYNEYLNYDMFNFPQFKLGKDMFSEQFLQDCIKHNVYIYSPHNMYGATYERYRKNSDTSQLHEIRSLLSGEAPELWKYETVIYGINNMRGLFGFTNSDISNSDNNRTVTYKPEFTNISDIPLPIVKKITNEYSGNWYYNIIKDTYLGLYETPAEGGGSYTWEVEEV